MSKGDHKRPRDIPKKVYEKNWDRIFRKSGDWCGTVPIVVVPELTNREESRDEQRVISKTSKVP